MVVFFVDMKSKVIFFRGRNTAGIIADAIRLGVVPDGAEIHIICRTNDPLSEPGDVTTPPEHPNPFPPGGPGFIVVANGGTTAQLVPTVAKYVFGVPAHKVRIVDVQRDGVTDLWGSFRP